MVKKRKGVMAPPTKVQRYSWMFERLNLRLKSLREGVASTDLTPHETLLLTWAKDALEHIGSVELENFVMQKRLDDAAKTFDKSESEIEDLKNKLDELNTDIADAAKKVVELVPVVLGREDSVSEPLEMFDLRRAVEDLKTVC